jgi:SAM-dependent methyltransferase
LTLNWNPREHYKDNRVAETYDSTRFDSLPGRVFDRLERRALLRALAGVPAGSEIVDLPCGTGRLAAALLAAGYRVTGIDISPAMLGQAARRLAGFGERFAWRVGDAVDLPPPAQPFAAALCARILMHFPLDQQVAFLRGVARQTDGLIVFNQSYASRYQRARRQLKRLLGHPEPVAYPLSEVDIGRLLEGAGLRERRRHWVAPGLSEAFFLVAEKTPASAAHENRTAPHTAAPR